jgi:hypothetical protein
MALSGDYSLVDLPGELLKEELYPHVINLKSIQVVVTLAETCKMLYQLFQTQLDQYAAEKLIEYITASEPPLTREESAMHTALMNMRLYAGLSISLNSPSLFFSPKKEKKDINRELAEKMIVANPRLILTEDLDNKYDRYSDANTPRHTPSFIAFHKGKHKISMFMDKFINTYKLTHQTDTQIETNPDIHETTGFKYDFSVD